MSLINVTRKERNGIASVSDDLITTDKIAVPIREISGEAYISVIESPLTGRGSETLVIGNYLVEEDLTTICDSTASLFKATVLTRGGRTPNAGWSILGFVAEKIMGPIMTEGTGSKFLYHEDNGTYPVEFVVSESPATIIAQTGTGGTASNIYTADGILEADRTVSGDSSSALFIENLKDFQLNSNDKARIIGTTEATLRSTNGDTLIDASNGRILFNNYESLKTIMVELTAAEIIGMNATPVTLIAGVVGSVIVVKELVFILDYGTTQFTGGGDIFIKTDAGEDVSGAVISSAFINSATDAIQVTGDTTNYYAYVPSDGITISNDTAPFATGDGVLRVIITYRVLPTGL